MIYAHQLFQSVPHDWPFAKFFSLTQPVHEWIPVIAQALHSFFNACPLDQRIHSTIPQRLVVQGDVYIGERVLLPQAGTLIGPLYIGDECELRPNIYLRGNVIVGKQCVLGHACELKNTLLLDHAQVSHRNYVGDSILGTGAHLGAGCVLSNLRFDGQEVWMHAPDGQKFPTGLKKLGGIMGDYAEAGCNSVLCPGACLFPHAKVFPCESFRGTRV